MQFFKEPVNNFVPVVSDGMVSTQVIGEVRSFPVLVINCTNHHDLHDLIIIHQDTPPGDANSCWAWPLLNKNIIYLKVKFIKPVVTTALFSFDIRIKGGLVDCIVHNRGLYIKEDTTVDIPLDIFGEPVVFIEVPSTATLPNWDSRYQKAQTKKYMRHGYSKKQAHEQAIKHINQLRTQWSRQLNEAKTS